MLSMVSVLFMNIIVMIMIIVTTTTITIDSILIAWNMVQSIVMIEIRYNQSILKGKLK